MPPKQQPGKSKQDFKTPAIFIAAAQNKLGIPNFSWDLAADTSNSQSPYGFYSKEQDSLIQDWTVRQGWQWLNPEFADIEPWVKKCRESAFFGARVACLLPASVGANWYRDYIEPCAYVLFLNGRLAFIPNEPKKLYPKDCMLVLYNKWAVGSDVWTWKS